MTVLRSLCLSLSSLSASVSLSLLISASFFPFLPLFFLLCDGLAITSTARCHYLSPPCFIVCFFFPLLHLLLLLVTSLAVVLRHSTNFNIPHIDFLTTPLPFAAPLSLSLLFSATLLSHSHPSACLSMVASCTPDEARSPSCWHHDHEGKRTEVEIISPEKKRA